MLASSTMNEKSTIICIIFFLRGNYQSMNIRCYIFSHYIFSKACKRTVRNIPAFSKADMYCLKFYARLPSPLSLRFNANVGVLCIQSIEYCITKISTLYFHYSFTSLVSFCSNTHFECDIWLWTNLCFLIIYSLLQFLRISAYISCISYNSLSIKLIHCVWSWS